MANRRGSQIKQGLIRSTSFNPLLILVITPCSYPLARSPSNILPNPRWRLFMPNRYRLLPLLILLISAPSLSILSRSTSPNSSRASVLPPPSRVETKDATSYFTGPCCHHTHKIHHIVLFLNNRHNHSAIDRTIAPNPSLILCA